MASVTNNARPPLPFGHSSAPYEKQQMMASNVKHMGPTPFYLSQLNNPIDSSNQYSNENLSRSVIDHGMQRLSMLDSRRETGNTHSDEQYRLNKANQEYQDQRNKVRERQSLAMSEEIDNHEKDIQELDYSCDGEMQNIRGMS